MNKVKYFIISPVVAAMLFIPTAVTSKETYKQEDVKLVKSVVVTAKPVKKITFANETVKRICSCESTGEPYNEPRHYESDGKTVLTGRVVKEDTGMCQINKTYWESKAIKLGYDLDTPSGNIAMANYIYRMYGTTPWDASSACWN